MTTAAYLSTREAQIYTGLRDLARRRVLGNGPDFVKAGEGRSGRVVYARDSLDAFMKARTRRSTSQDSAAQSISEASAPEAAA